MQEHLVAVDDQNHRVSCWVPSEPGRTFAVHWRDHGSKVDTCAFITLDGFVVPGRFLFGSGDASRQGVRTGSATERPFAFSKVEETTEETYDQSATKDVGMIILRIKRIERNGGRPANAIQQVPTTNKGNRALGDLCIGFGEEKDAYQQYTTTWSVKPYSRDRPKSNKPCTYVTFVFRYRPPEFLKAQGIMSDVRKPSGPRRTPMRRVASAPATSSVPITPSPTPSPRQRELYPRSFARVFQPRRIMSSRGVSQNDRFPGQVTLRFDDGREEKGDATATPAGIVEDLEDNAA